MSLSKIESAAKICEACGLCKERTQVVFAKGNPNAKIMFVGEGPGADEDLVGIPFVGRAGQLLDKMLASIDLSLEDVYICNVVKCRPPNNRAPLPEEIARCLPFLKAQIDFIKPSLIVALGNTATRTLTNTKFGITKVRGKSLKYFDTNIIVIPTFHPSYLLRDPTKKPLSYEDLLFIQQTYKELKLK